MSRRPQPGWKLNDEIRAAIVTCFARYMTPQQACDAVSEQFALDPPLDRRSLHRYNPERFRGGKMADKWRRLHADVRERFLTDLEAMPIAHKAYRMRELQRLYDTLTDTSTKDAKPNFPEAAKILKQAAEEVGGILTNERRVQHSGKVTVEEEMTVDEKRAMIADMLAEAWEKDREIERAGGPQTRH